jgi:hypothetical protein
VDGIGNRLERSMNDESDDEMCIVHDSRTIDTPAARVGIRVLASLG